MKTFRHVNYLWDDVQAAKLTGVERLVYRSNLLGSDLRITNTGGGNTSSKLTERDPLTGKEVEVLWVKGSGGDLRTSKRDNFASLYQDKLLALQRQNQDEDARVGMYAHCTFNLNPRAPSIDTPLHAFVPCKHVDHMHPNAVIAIAASRNGEKLTRDVFGDEIVWTPWQRPGFDLGLKLQEICRQHPNAKGVILGQHGLVNWANDDKECYELTLSLIERAAEFIERHDKGAKTFGGAKYRPHERRREVFVQILPWLRGQIAQQNRVIATIQDDDTMLRFVNGADAPRLAELGTSCPDHFLRTKIKPLYVGWNPQSEDLPALKKKLAEGLAKYRQTYSDYYNRCKHPDSPAMRDPNPTVILIPGLGMIAWGKDKSESSITAEFYNCAVEVMRGAEAIGEYVALSQQEAFNIEYWALEEAKLRRMPPERELSRQIIAVIGAGSGIGRETAHRLATEGAHVVSVDLAAADLAADITKRDSIRAMLDEITLAYGGLDAIAITAGVFVAPDTTGHIPDEKWAQTFAVNVTGAYLVADEAVKLWREQGLPANLVITTSVNAVVPKPGSVAYDTSKAAANHLVRELAVELAPLVRVNGVAPATVVQGSAMFPRERVISSLVKYGIAYDEKEDDDTLRGKLAQFYADRTLTKRPITPADQAEAIFLLLTNRLSKTTGQIISVDGGLHEAFLR